MDYELHRGDCLDIMQTLAGPVDMVLADLPYGTTACAWDSVIPFEPLWTQYKRLIKPRGAVVLFGSQPFTSALVMSQPGWFKQEIIWDKFAPVGFLNARRYMLNRHENILLFCNGTPTYNPQGLTPTSIKSSRENGKTKGGGTYGNVADDLYINTETNFPTTIVEMCRVTNYQVHPTQKPVALLEYLIRTYTNDGETVLDNTMGSGSTGVACMNTKRRFIGIEQDADYFAIAERRIADAARQVRGEFRHVTDTQTHEDLPLFAEAHP